jgi:hypothetical protein
MIALTEPTEATLRSDKISLCARMRDLPDLSVGSVGTVRADKSRYHTQRRISLENAALRLRE